MGRKRISSPARKGELRSQELQELQNGQRVNLTSHFYNMAKPAETFMDLVVWQKAHRVVLAT
jgi:hypothetical protein